MKALFTGIIKRKYDYSNIDIFKQNVSFSGRNPGIYGTETG